MGRVVLRFMTPGASLDLRRVTKISAGVVQLPVKIFPVRTISSSRSCSMRPTMLKIRTSLASILATRFIGSRVTQVPPSLALLQANRRLQRVAEVSYFFRALLNVPYFSTSFITGVKGLRNGSRGNWRYLGSEMAD